MALWEESAPGRAIPHGKGLAAKKVSSLSLGVCKHRQIGCLSGKRQRGFLPQTGGGWADKVKLREKKGPSGGPSVL